MSVSKIGRYEIESELTMGGMGVIILAKDPYIQRQVVVKVLMYSRTLDEMYRDFFQNEAEVIAALEHPCIVPIYDFGWHGQQPYIVMRYMAGGSLQDRLDKGDIKLTEMAHILKRVGDALDAAHAKGIIHRDIKPSNILFDASGESFLSDFGIATSKSIKDDDGEWLVGTPAYMSPEQARGAHVDARSDVYSLGVTLYRLLAGQLPFSSDSATSLINSHAKMPIPDIRSVKSNIPAVWQEVVAKAMAKEPDDRYATAGDFARDVNEVVSGKWYLRKL
ncbi:MAG: serine/threonine protein kinase [Anaerolineales bacterium]|jgi:serine/threonine protein kinase|uniref:serine/threonine protein kinase n=1 Tax=Candidatus Villigracilis vicinus TaxID=3140679 RepID=UPI0031354447|nr:serine/threonine protein kinase [Anaerolineales bacterium]MBK7451106.1 serine/threonine protein kinase [Anaerolineales bacterium]MBK9779352.1 serine/threonine protein kinase [Anaerolineales bacterium]